MEKHHTHHKALKPGVMQVLLRKSMENLPVLVPKMGSWKFPVMFTKNKHVSNGAWSIFLCDAAPPPISNDDL